MAQRKNVTLAARDVLLDAEVLSTASRFASSSDPRNNDRGKKRSGFCSPCGSNYTLSGRFQVGDKTGRLNLQNSLCFVALNFSASWGPSWFCFQWNHFLPPGFFCQYNGFLLSTSEFTTKLQKQNKNRCMASLRSEDHLHAFRPNFRIRKMEKKKSHSQTNQVNLTFGLNTWGYTQWASRTDIYNKHLSPNITSLWDTTSLIMDDLPLWN